MNDIDILKLYYKGEELEEKIKEYENGKPAAYIIGEWEFFTDRYLIDENCLIPRCDTERVVEEVISNLNKNENSYIADLCTGTGCIIISSIKRNANTKGIAVDISKGAIEIAKKNAEINNVSDKIDFICEDLFNLSLEVNKFDIIVSNPPYIPTKDLASLDEYVKNEPIAALDGGVDGMDFYKFIVSKYRTSLKINGKFIFEIGYDQEEQIKQVACENSMTCTVKKDYSGNPRVAILEK